MNSAAWLVKAGDGSQFVVKASAASDAAGLAVAARLQERGFRAGGPVRMLRTEDGGLVALLRFVPGRPLTHADAELVGETLGLAHSLLAEVPAPDGLDHWPWQWLDSSLIEAADLRRQADVVIAEAEALTADISHSILHGDPAPEAFLADRNEVGLIDWGAAVHGPCSTTWPPLTCTAGLALSPGTDGQARYRQLSSNTSIYSVVSAGSFRPGTSLGGSQRTT